MDVKERLHCYCINLISVNRVLKFVRNFSISNKSTITVLMMDQHITEVICECVYHAHALQRILPPLTFEVNKMIGHSMTSNAVVCGTSVGCSIHTIYWIRWYGRPHVLPVALSCDDSFISYKFIFRCQTKLEVEGLTPSHGNDWLFLR